MRLTTTDRQPGGRSSNNQHISTQGPRVPAHFPGAAGEARAPWGERFCGAKTVKASRLSRHSHAGTLQRALPARKAELVAVFFSKDIFFPSL